MKKDKFNEYYNKWNEETMVLSTGIFENKWFKKIVEMGNDAVPFIKEKLFERDDWLVVALDRIYPNVMVYKGFVPLHDACQMWRITLKLIESNFKIEEKQ